MGRGTLFCKSLTNNSHPVLQKQITSVFGGGLNAFSKYERGEIIQSEAMDKLIRVTCRYSEAWNYLNSINDGQNGRTLSLKSRDLLR